MLSWIMGYPCDKTMFQDKRCYKGVASSLSDPRRCLLCRGLHLYIYSACQREPAAFVVLLSTTACHHTVHEARRDLRCMPACIAVWCPATNCHRVNDDMFWKVGLVDSNYVHTFLSSISIYVITNPHPMGNAITPLLHTTVFISTPRLHFKGFPRRFSSSFPRSSLK